MEHRSMGWDGFLPRALRPRQLLPGVVWRAREGQGAQEGPSREGHLQLPPRMSFGPTFQVCYAREILGCILIKQWNFYFFFS